MNRIAAVAATLLCLLALVGCGSLPSSPNLDRARIGLDSVDGRVGELRLLSVSVASPGGRGSVHVAGDSAALLLTIANDGAADDELTGVATDVPDDAGPEPDDARPGPDVAAPWPDRPVLDLRSSGYAAMWRPTGRLAERTVTVRVLHEQVVAGEVRRSVVSHFNKASKGRLVRDLLLADAAPRSAGRLVEGLRDLKYTVEERPTAAGRSRQADVIVREL